MGNKNTHGKHSKSEQDDRSHIQTAESKLQHSRSDVKDRERNGKSSTTDQDISKFLANLSLRLSFRTNPSIRSTNTSLSHGRLRASRRRLKPETFEDPYLSARTAWPVSLTESAFLPDFSIKGVVDERDFIIHGTIASGSYGKVFLAEKRDTKERYAVKILSKSQIMKENALQQVKDEVRIQSLCGHHPFLVAAPYFWQSRKSLFIVTEYIEHGELQKLWSISGPFSEDLAKIYVAEIALAVDFLHNAGVIHRDIKLENLLIDSVGHLRLIDFGLAKWLKLGGRTSTFCGTLQYMAPEVLTVDSYGHSADWWSVGVILFALLEGKLPLSSCTSIEEVRQYWKQGGDPVQQSTLLAPPTRLLLKALLHVDPQDRLRSLRVMQQSAFYHKFNWDRLRSKQIDPLPLLEAQRQKRREASDEMLQDPFPDF